MYLLSVIIAAYNEELVLGRCLTSILTAAKQNELEVIVVCNGCDDRTADIARSFGRPVTVIETSVASKPKALNLGDQVATSYPRFYVDADVQLGICDLRKVAEVLRRGDVLAAAPSREIDLEGRSWLIQAYFQFWLQMPFFQDEQLGGGLYAVSETGRKAFGLFPEPGQDDIWVSGHFDKTERRVVHDARFIVPAPFTLSDLIRSKARMRANRKFMAGIIASLPGMHFYGASGVLAVVRQKPYLAPQAVVYSTITLLAEFRAWWKVMRNDRTWDKDARINPYDVGVGRGDR